MQHRLENSPSVIKKITVMSSLSWTSKHGVKRVFFKFILLQ